ncbi:predicted protein [Nematostella vectensis]|uniref:SUMO-activating enzyme subunit 1 n=1 Tax=Nematostella vectensis TaxID=45351 RepID=A7RG90_NEMVE|nr:predicted protein [Nematostella vectensis]|eukprot:XP_001641443.1 predicted protein [Nematostella vectensis]
MGDNKNGEPITEAEAALYDRQIRLWGLDAQKRLRASRILVVGLAGIGAEICKNLVLSGVKSLTMLDNNPVTERDFVSQFLAPREALGKNRAEASLARTQALNPMVAVSADKNNITAKADTFLDDFDVVVATGCSSDILVSIYERCRAKNIKFFASDVFGFYGYMFADLGKHRYVEEERKTIHSAEKKEKEPAKKKQKIDSTETKTVEKFCEFSSLKNSLSCSFSETRVKSLKRLPSVYFILQVILRFRAKHGRAPDSLQRTSDEKELNCLKQEVMSDLNISQDLIDQDFACHCLSELSPVCAIVGGVVGQEIVKAVSGKDAPLNNFFFYDGLEGHGMVECFK